MPRPPAQPVRLRGLLKENAGLAALLPEAERLRELNRRFARAVGPVLARACRVAALQGDAAVVYCGNGAAAARLRAQSATVCRALADGNAPVSELKIKLRADWAQAPRPEKTGMGSQALAAWEALESSVADPELKAAIARLLRHQRG
ncbi:MAG: DciA family protein [Pseudomonadota bacterium]